MHVRFLRWLAAVAIVCTVLLAAPLARAADPPPAKVSFVPGENTLTVQIAGQSIATYVTSDEQILRPYFRDLRTLSRLPVTRRHPPQKPDDLDDHPTMHPGLWLAFGDLNGSDFWRNKAQVKHEGYLVPPTGGDGRGWFAVHNRYESAGKLLGTEHCTLTFTGHPTGYLIDWVSEFRGAESELAFGDQEEMGLGIRVASPLAVAQGGQILNSDERKNASQVWGRQADWCAYFGTLQDRRISVLLMPAPANFRRSWFHARDYGLLVANPFGQNAFTKGTKSRLSVILDQTLRLRFGILVSEESTDAPLSFESSYQQYLAISERAP